jgi:hypothetical protein
VGAGGAGTSWEAFVPSARIGLEAIQLKPAERIASFEIKICFL